MSDSNNSRGLQESLVVPQGERPFTYESYLRIPDLLALQLPVSRPAEHDETLFIIIHQVYELWFKQILHEVDGAQEALEKGNLMRVLRALRRVNVIQDVLVHQVDILETMTPNDFNMFRDNLNPASGFQSLQFRLLEYRLGMKDKAYMKFHKTQPVAMATLESAIHRPSLYDSFIRCARNKGLPISESAASRQFVDAYVSDDSVRDAWLSVYRNPDSNYDLYLALEAMIDLDERLTIWRYRHVAMVERMIGSRRGTGGSSGVKYLAGTLEKRAFPEIWEVRNLMGKGYGGR